MPHINADLVRETTSTTGTGTYTLAGAQTGYRAFSNALATNDTCWYAARFATDYEVGIGTLTGATTLARTVIIRSSNAGAAVNWGAGVKDIYITTPAEDPLRILHTPLIPPQGRLSLSSGNAHPLSVAGATIVYYTPYIGRIVPINNGSYFRPHDIGGELSQATTDTTKSPAAVTTSSIYDIFVWLDGTVYRATRGPAWTSNTSRGTGAGTTELVRVEGILVNANAITNGPAAQRGTYVGSIRSDSGAATISFLFPSDGVAAILGVWNMYNRLNIHSGTSINTSSWTYTSSTARESNGSTTARCNFLSGWAEDFIEAVHHTVLQTSVSGSFFSIGLGFDQVTVMQKHAVYHHSTSGQVITSVSARQLFEPQLGWHFVAPMEAGDNANAFTVFGQSRMTFHVGLRM